MIIQMKTLYRILCVFAVFVPCVVWAQTGIGTGDAVEPSAELEVKSIKRGLLIPRLTQAQRNNLDALTPPAAGLMIYNTTTGNFNYFDGAVWLEFYNQLSTGIVDIDADTRVQVQETVGDNQIRFDVEGLEVAVLNNSGFSLISGDYYIGDKRALLTSAQNIFMGDNAGGNAVSADSTVIVGESAGQAALTANANVMYGAESGTATTSGERNVMLGYQSGTNNVDGSQNVFAGHQAGLSNTSASGNIYIGAGAGMNNNGSDNIFIGAEAGAGATTATNNIVIGAGQSVGSAGSDSLRIGSVLSGSFSSGHVRFNDTYSFPATDGTEDALMKIDANGQLYWIERAPDSLRAAAADLQPSDLFVMDNSQSLSSRIYYMNTFSFATATVTKLTTYIVSNGDGANVYLGIYDSSGNRISFASGSLGASLTEGYLTVHLPDEVPITKGDEFFLALSCDKTTTTFKSTVDTFNPGYQENGSGMPATINVGSTTTTSFWIRAH